MLTFAGGLVESLADALFPARCRLCGAQAADGLACPLHSFRRELPGPRCGLCAALLPPSLPSGYLCAACRLERPRHGRVVALSDYHRDPALREWILRLKHGGRADLALLLGRALGARLEEHEARDPRLVGRACAPLLVPVPLHRLRRFERGYDQAQLLAESAAAWGGRDVLRALERARCTLPQGALGSVSRPANVRGAFRPRRALRGRLGGREIWLVDDVVTSGATASECARALRGAGARVLGVLCLARASR